MSMICASVWYTIDGNSLKRGEEMGIETCVSVYSLMQGNLVELEGY